MAEHAPTPHRLRAVTRILSGYGCFELDRQSADRMWRAVTSMMPTSELEALDYECCAMQYYALVVGSADLSIVHANRSVAIVTTSRQCHHNDTRRVLPLVADTFEWLGDVERSLVLRRMLLDRGHQLKRRSLVLSALLGLIGTLLDLGRHEEARALLAEFGRPPVKGAAHGGYDRARLIYWVTCALEEGNVAQARADLTLPIEAADNIHGMSRARILSMYAHVALLERDDTTASTLLPLLLGCFVERYNFMDHPALVTARCLERFEGLDAATAFVQRFVRDHRYERWTPRAELRRYLTDSSAVDHHTITTSPVLPSGSTS
jgi:hypothetical protein